MSDSSFRRILRARRGLAPLWALWLVAWLGVAGWLGARSLTTAPAAADAAASAALTPSSTPGLRAVPIEQVRPGQRVWAYDAAADAWRACVVEEAYTRDYHGDMVAVTAGGGSDVLATGNHPFWVEAGEDLEARPSVAELTEQETRGPPGTRGRWVEARDLREGDVLVRGDGGRTTVTSLRSWQAQTPVYNLRVAELHTYAVGELALAAHNNNGCPPGGGGGGGGGTRPGDLPGSGPPNGSLATEKKGGQIRDYGPDGRAKTDYDFGHDHTGAGKPHAHDWDWSKKPPRGPPRPLRPGE